MAHRLRTMVGFLQVTDSECSGYRSTHTGSFRLGRRVGNPGPSPSHRDGPGLVVGGPSVSNASRSCFKAVLESLADLLLGQAWSLRVTGTLFRHGRRMGQRVFKMYGSSSAVNL